MIRFIRDRCMNESGVTAARETSESYGNTQRESRLRAKHLTLDVVRRGHPDTRAERMDQHAYHQTKRGTLPKRLGNEASSNGSFPHAVQPLLPHPPLYQG